MRKATVTRTTKETDITLTLNIDGGGSFTGGSGIGFFDHMLNSLAVHSGFDISLAAKGDLYVDCHHTVEDIGIVFGKVLSQALTDKRGLTRYGTFTVPMDEALATVSLDISGRPYLVFNAVFPDSKAGELDTCMVKEFFTALAMNSGITLHVNLQYGENTHHEIEAIFKAFAHALKTAVSKTGAETELSSKGVL